MSQMITNQYKKQALAGTIILITASIIFTSVILYSNYDPIEYEKRALIFHANTLQTLELETGETVELIGIDREFYIDVGNLHNQLILNDYVTSWYYFDTENSPINVLRTLKIESRRSKQLIVIFVSHAGIDSQSNEFGHFLDKFYSSNDIMNALNKDTKTYIFSAGCHTGYFARDYQLPKNWIISSSVNKEVDICNVSLYIDVNVSTDQVWYIDDALIRWSSIEALSFAFGTESCIEDIYLAQITYLETYYLGVYFSWDNAPQIWDADTTTNWRI